MKKAKINIFKCLGILLVAVFVSQTLTFGTGNALAEISSMVNVGSSHVEALASTSDVIELTSAEALINWLKNRGAYDKVKLVGDNGTIFDIANRDYYNYKTFYGTFDGGYVLLRNVVDPLFGTLQNATVKNVYIDSGNIEIAGTNAVGSIALQAAGATQIINCLNKANVTLSNSTYEQSYAGGIVGYATGSSKIELCSNHANVSVENRKSTGKHYAYAGGIVGHLGDSSTVNNCYVAPVNNSNISIVAENAFDVVDTAITVKKKGKDSKYYNGLTGVVQKVNEKFNDLKNQIAGKNNEESALRKSINNLKSQINSLDRQIKSFDSKIANVQSKINNSKWYDVRRAVWAAEIAGYRVAQGALRVSQGALWTSVGALEASIVAVRAAITVLQKTLEATSAIITNSYSDTNWLEFSKDAKKVVTHEDSYAYGIGYAASKKNTIANSYTYKVNCEGGEYTTKYTYYLKFWSQSEFLKLTGGALTGQTLFSSPEFTKYLTFKAENYYGPVSNIVSTNTYYFTGNGYSIEQYKDNRYIYIDNNESYNYNHKTETLREQHSVHASLKNQQFFLTNKGTETITMAVSNGHTFVDDILKGFVDEGVTVLSNTFDDSILKLKIEGTQKNATNATDRRILNNASGGDVWGTDARINNGLPYLKCRYWEFMN